MRSVLTVMLLLMIEQYITNIALNILIAQGFLQSFGFMAYPYTGCSTQEVNQCDLGTIEFTEKFEGGNFPLFSFCTQNMK